MMDRYVIDPSKVRDISADVLDEKEQLRVLPAAYWETTTPQERAMFGVRNGIYSFPTVELVEYLKLLIGDRSAIEIGAGCGVLATALDIPGTDSYQQEQPHIAAYYRLFGQPTERYGKHGVKLNAAQAISRYKPKVVIGCWVTEKYRRSLHHAQGADALANVAGIDEQNILRKCETYILVGNEKIHEGKVIWKKPHRIEYPPFVYSRAMNGTRDFVAVWDRG